MKTSVAIFIIMSVGLNMALLYRPIPVNECVGVIKDKFGGSVEFHGKLVSPI